MARPRPCPEKCNVLLVGGGGREHALAWKLRQSPRLGTLWLTHPGNGGLAGLGKACPEKMDMKNEFVMQRWCDRNDIHLVVVGPEGPLAAGISDVLQTEHRRVFGPTKRGAQIEADKAYAKQLMRQVAVPTAEARVFHDIESADHYVRVHEDPCVVKAAGLAAGKGVIVCDTQDEAIAAVNRVLVDREFGEAGSTVIVEEKLVGQEVSVLALVDGRTIWMLDPCQDHKQLCEGDTGPNTGGMGAYCPTPVLDVDTRSEIEQNIFVPIVDAMRREGIDYRGVLYAGLILTPAGPKVLEFNCRFGDPECQALLPRMQGDLVELLWATCTGQLDHIRISFDPRVACCVVMCADGYPASYEKGRPVTGLDDLGTVAGPDDELIVFHAGTAVNQHGELVTNGGRVLGVTALAGDLLAARDLANAACERIDFEGAYYRRDIGDRVLVRS